MVFYHHENHREELLCYIWTHTGFIEQVPSPRPVNYLRNSVSAHYHLTPLRHAFALRCAVLTWAVYLCQEHLTFNKGVIDMACSDTACETFDEQVLD